MGSAMTELGADYEKLKMTQHDTVGIRKVIQRGSTDLRPKKCASVGQSGPFKRSTREVKEHARMAYHAAQVLFKPGEITEASIVSQTDVSAQLEDLDHDWHYLLNVFGFWTARQHCIRLMQTPALSQKNTSQQQSWCDGSSSTSRRSPPTYLSASLR